MIIFSNLLHSQNQNEIRIEFNKNSYLKIASDSIKILFERQKKYYKLNKSSIDPIIIKNAISLNYDFKNLNYYIIPRYRLYAETVSKYDCDSNIEDYIVFNDRCKYQTVVVKSKEEILCDIEVPNFIFEFQRLYNPSPFTNLLSTKEFYEEYYLNKLVSDKRSIYKIIEARPQNFYFELYGLDDVVFEIDTKSNVLFANYFGLLIEENQVRMPANDFIRKYFGVNVIKELAKGNYKDFDAIGSLIEFVPCERKNNINTKTTFIIEYK